MLDSDEEERSSDVELLQGPSGGGGMEGVVEEVSLLDHERVDEGFGRREEGGRGGGGRRVSSLEREGGTNEEARETAQTSRFFVSLFHKYILTSSLLRPLPLRFDPVQPPLFSQDFKGKGRTRAGEQLPTPPPNNDSTTIAGSPKKEFGKDFKACKEVSFQ